MPPIRPLRALTLGLLLLLAVPGVGAAQELQPLIQGWEQHFSVTWDKVQRRIPPAADGSESEYPWGNTTPSPQHGNFDFSAWSPMPVGARPAGASRWGVLELAGNGWELTDTPFAPFPRFSPYMASYPDYSRDFFDGKHFVLKGASWATAGDLLRPSFRNWYQAHYPYVFAKFRCVSD